MTPPASATASTTGTPPMRLLSAPASPFGRKVKIVAHIKGLADQIRIEQVDTRAPGNTPLKAANPLGKIPVLILADGTALYDSREICEYLDHIVPAGSPTLFPSWDQGRAHMLTRAALADGLMQAAVLIVYEERYREPHERSASWVARQQSKVDAALEAMSLEVGMRQGNGVAGSNPLSYDRIATACALGYLDLRFAGAWRHKHPALVAELDRFAAQVPAYAATMPT